jgi:quinohemoprotein ethanol dehydrogenase
MAVLRCGTWAAATLAVSISAWAGQPIDGARIANADAEPGNWLSYGRTYSEQRFSPLTQINDGNAGRLGLAWYADLDTNRGQEATPLIIDGRLYVSTAWSLVKAYDAKSGQLLWAYDPHVKRELGLNACCDVGNRGVAAWGDNIYVGAYDGRLIALNAATGQEVWSTVTVEPGMPYTITQAPRVIKGCVIIGNSGGEDGARGYISAYDALLYRARRPLQTFRKRCDAQGCENLGGRLVETRRRGSRVGRDFLRS